MKILIVNTSDIIGGAARASYRLHKALLKNGIDSQMLVQNKSSDDYTVISDSSKLKQLLNKTRNTIDSLPLKIYKNRDKGTFSLNWLYSIKLIKKINEINPDVVHINWINAGMLRIKDLVKINSPIIFTMHDNWLFTGGCHVKYNCDRFQSNCQKCPKLNSKFIYDLSSWTFNRKKKVFIKLENSIIISPSKWLMDEAKKSALLKNFHIVNIPNIIDVNVFKPIDKVISRKIWSLPQEKKLILFGAVGALSDKNKGFKELSKGLENLDKDLNIEFVVFGSSQPQNAHDFGFKTHYLGSLHDDVSLVTLYSAVDVMVVPSLQENLSNAIMESLACGTPVVGFEIGGNSDMIEHQKTGYLAKPFESKDLADGIEWVLNASKYNELCINAREKVVREFDSALVVEKYQALYKKVIVGGFDS